MTLLCLHFSFSFFFKLVKWSKVQFQRNSKKIDSQNGEGRSPFCKEAKTQILDPLFLTPRPYSFNYQKFSCSQQEVVKSTSKLAQSTSDEIRFSLNTTSGKCVDDTVVKETDTHKWDSIKFVCKITGFAAISLSCVHKVYNYQLNVAVLIKQQQIMHSFRQTTAQHFFLKRS